MKNSETQADICLILEGTYPYVMGGVSNWTHDLISNLSNFKFHLLSIVPSQFDMVPKYTLPQNVVGISHIVLQQLPLGKTRIRNGRDFFNQLAGPLPRLFLDGKLSDFAEVLRIVSPHRDQLGSRLLLDSWDSWQILLEAYHKHYHSNSFLDFFWSWRGLWGGLFSVLLAKIPAAGVYHSICTGYAGLVAARATLETKRPAMITEHGIYTNERRIEITASDWVQGQPMTRLSIQKMDPDLKDLWINTFTNYSKICYEASQKIITLFTGNQKFQEDDGAMPDKFAIVPNGVDYAEYSAISREKKGRPSIALIGRVVPIKDVKTFIRACAILRNNIADLQAYIIGPTDADPAYYEECKQLVDHLGMENIILFTGRVDIKDYMGRINVNVLTSISEAQPLVILEAACLGIPSVATNVGSCAELIQGNSVESPALGPAGEVTPLSNPSAIAKAIERLLTDPDWYNQCSTTSRERVRRYYNKVNLVRDYQEIYQNFLSAAEVPITVET